MSTCSSKPIEQIQYSVCSTMGGEDSNNYDTVTKFVIDSACTEHMVQEEVPLHQNRSVKSSAVKFGNDGILAASHIGKLKTVKVMLTAVLKVP